MFAKYLSSFIVVSLLACGAEDNVEEPAQQQSIEDTVAHECVAEGTGNLPGDKIADAVLVNCLGERVSIHSSCGKGKLTVVALGALWCGACEGYFKSLTYDHAISEPGSWDYYIIEGQALDRSTNITPEACVEYAEKINADPARVLIDPNWRTSINSGLIDVCSSNGSISLPFMSILDSWDFTYEYSRPCGGSSDDRSNWRESFIGELREE
tara:strand:- start:209 stop:841 length:633 start_codon:yes stop_codon:yes gene_type:complete